MAQLGLTGFRRFYLPRENPVKFKYLVSTLLLTASVAACSDEQHPTLSAGGAAPHASKAGENTSTRADESPHNSVHINDARLWQLLDGGANTAFVGFKAPGKARGMWRAQRLMTRAEEEISRNAVISLPGVTLVRHLPPLPLVELRIADTTALRKLRQLPFVDYVEPAVIPRSVREEAIAKFGEQSAFMSNCRLPEAYTEMLSQTEFGDKVSYSYSDYHQQHRIVSAWRRTQGDNIRIGVVDTGMDPLQGQLTDPAQFNPRPWEYSRTIDGHVGSGSSDPCGHGTRMAGVIGAPNDGRSVVGIAWKSDLRIINVASREFSTDGTYYDYIVSVNPSYVYYGIMEAMGDERDHATGGIRRVRAPSNIINMAFKTYSDPVTQAYPDSVADLIRYHYYSSGGPLFIAAIGTMPSGQPNAIFPAEMEEVVAVVALNADGSRNGESNWGPKSELAAFIPVASVSTPSLGGHQGITRIMGSSGASATISGIAALVWSRYPWMSNTDVRARLRSSARHPWNRTWEDGFGYVDAYVAVGGLTHLQFDVKGCATAYTPEIYATASPTGDGPFRYQWSNGDTGPSTTYTAASEGESLHVYVSVTDLTEGRTREDGRWVETVTAQDPRFMECL
jgi:hypothetical protein